MQWSVLLRHSGTLVEVHGYEFFQIPVMQVVQKASAGLVPVLVN